MHAGRDHPSEEGRRGVPGLPVLLEHDFGDPGRGVEAHEIEQGEGAHGMAAAKLHSPIDVGDRAHAPLERPYRVEEVRHEQQVHDEPGPVAGDDRLLAQPPDELDRGVERLLRGGHRPDHLHQRHQGHGVEEMEADKAVGPRGGGGHLADDEARGVGGEDRRRWAERVQLAPEGVLDLEVLGDGFDHEVAGPERADVGGERQPLQRGHAGAGVDLALLDQLVERPSDSGPAFGQESLADVAHHGGKPGHRGHLRDPAAHEAAADHADAVDAGHGHLSDFSAFRTSSASRSSSRGGVEESKRSARLPCSSSSRARSRPSWSRATTGP